MNDTKTYSSLKVTHETTTALKAVQHELEHTTGVRVSQAKILQGIVGGAYRQLLTGK